MDATAMHRRLHGLEQSLGSESRELQIGEDVVRLDGLAPDLARTLERRWGGFLHAEDAAEPSVGLRLYDAGARGWLGDPQPGEQYRIESHGEGDSRVVASYNFALAPDADGGWRLGVTRREGEPLGRILDNAARYIAARIAIDRGGFAMHAAAALHEGEAFVFGGPSGSGKTTALGLARPARSLGDDFALVVPGADGWLAPALPFDNSERIPNDAIQGSFPVHGIWRLVQAEETRVERLPAGLAVASLMGCVAFPWTMPEHADRLLEHVGDFVARGLFGRLHFNRTDGLWTHLVHSGQRGD